MKLFSPIKISLLLAVCSILALGGAVFWLMPAYQHILYLRHQHTTLERQWHNRHQQAVQWQQLQQELTLMEYQHGSRLHALQHPTTLATLLQRITLLINSQQLQLVALKPQQKQAIAGLTKQIITIDIKGSEPHILNFLQLITHQPWLTGFEQLHFSASPTGLQLQANLEIYYASV